MIGKMLGNRYELIEKIGEGGMGLVYKAKCHLLNRYVAVKILKPELTKDEEFINKFRKESLSAASLSHPNIVNIYDVGIEDGIYYIVMEYVNGKTLKDIIKERAPMPYYEVINIARQICLGLDHAHNNNIIHRDIKPQNILITQDGIVKVADFGIARVSSSATLTNTGRVLGSAYYISPEQARGGYIDKKTDIYSLGTVMYEMATGRVPFEGESPVVVALKHIQDNVIKPSEINGDIPVAVEDVIMKTLEKSPSLRYESAAAMVKDLDRASSNPDKHIYSKNDSLNEMTRVMPAINESEIKKSPGTRRKTKKKNNKGLIAALVIFIILVVVSVSALFMYMAYGGRRDEVVVPSIIGYDERIAEQMLKDSGINMEVSERRFSSDIPEGEIINVWPEVGTRVKKNSTVKVVVSAGQEKVLVPNLIGSTLAEAEYKLESAGLTKGEVIVMNNDEYEKDKIFKQSPEPNSEAAKGSAVDIYVSKGKEIVLVNVPQIEGIEADKLDDFFEQNKLTKGKVGYESDPSKPDNVVIHQSIPKDTQVPEYTTVDVIINKIVPEVTVTPEVTPPDNTGTSGNSESRGTSKSSSNSGSSETSNTIESKEVSNVADSN